jgi:hypothetical protein
MSWFITELSSFTCSRVADGQQEAEYQQPDPRDYQDGYCPSECGHGVSQLPASTGDGIPRSQPLPG